MLVILDRGHGQKARAARFDPGAEFNKMREVDLAAGYIAEARRVLVEEGHTVHLLESGTYDDRHREAIWMASGSKLEAIYVQCHVNAGGGKYGLIEHDARSSWGRTAAAFLADALDELPEVPVARVWSLDSTQRGWSCIDGIYDSPTMTGVLYEPGFIDTVVHSTLWTPEGLGRVGRALAEGIERYGTWVASRKAA